MQKIQKQKMPTSAGIPTCARPLLKPRVNPLRNPLYRRLASCVVAMLTATSGQQSTKKRRKISAKALSFHYRQSVAVFGVAHCWGVGARQGGALAVQACQQKHPQPAPVCRLPPALRAFRSSFGADLYTFTTLPTVFCGLYTGVYI